MGAGEKSFWQDLTHVITSTPKNSFKAVFSATYKPSQIEAFKKLFVDVTMLSSNNFSKEASVLPHIKEVSL